MTGRLPHGTLCRVTTNTTRRVLADVAAAPSRQQPWSLPACSTGGWAVAGTVEPGELDVVVAVRGTDNVLYTRQRVDGQLQPYQNLCGFLVDDPAVDDDETGRPVLVVRKRADCTHRAPPRNAAHQPSASRPASTSWEI